MPSDRTRLSPREREVLTLAGDGLNSKEIARRLDISPRTVDAHVAKAVTALGARNRTEAALLLNQEPSVKLPTQPPTLAAPASPAPGMPSDRGEGDAWWRRLPLRRDGRLGNGLTTFQRLAWIAFGAVAIIFVFSQLANGLHVAQEIALGLKR